MLVGSCTLSTHLCLKTNTKRVQGHPFDLTKTRLQTAAPGTYTGAIDVVKKALARDGATGYVTSRHLKHSKVVTTIYSLYRGVVPPLLGVTPIFAVSFWVCVCRVLKSYAE